MTAASLWQKHGMSAGDLARMREAQQGLCYLCGNPLPDDGYFLAIDHDHRCCPPKKSCAYCRRGLTCHSCNLVIGHVHDDPERLRNIAGNLEVALAAVAQRIARKPSQAALFEPGERAIVTRQPRPRRAQGTLADVLKIFRGDKGLHWEVVAARLAAEFPDRWAEVTASVISAQCRALGVPSTGVRYPAGRRGHNRRGCRRADVMDATTRQTPLTA